MAGMCSPISMIGTSNHRSPAGAGATGTVPVGESLAGFPWKLNPAVFSGDSVHFRSSLKKQAIIFPEYVGFGRVLKGTREIPVVDPSIPYGQLRSQDFTHDENDTYRRVNQFLRSVSAKGTTIKTTAYMTEGIVAAVPAWTDLNTNVALTVSTA